MRSLKYPVIIGAPNIYGKLVKCFTFAGRNIRNASMKSVKSILCTLMCLICLDSFAGGLVTNNNQNPIFFRQPAQNAVVGVQGAYYNPAGLTLLDKGWHFYVGNQMAVQTRYITSTYAPFALGAKNGGSPTKEFRGDTFAPFIPNIDAVYTHGRWAASFHLGITSGGGNCTFDNGLGSFEAPMALIPAAVNAIGRGMGMQSDVFGGYDIDMNFIGKSFGIGTQLNFSYKIIDSGIHKLSVGAGIRANYFKNDYSGGLYNYQLAMGGQMIPAAKAITGVLLQMGIPQEQAGAIGSQVGSDKEVKCIQTDWAWTPILSLHYRVSIVDIALRYEFNTSVRLKNKTDVNTAGIAQFEDGKETPADIPALLSGGVNVNILPVLRAGVGLNIYYDKNANYNGKQDLLAGNTHEYYIGAEWDICKLFTVSAGSQITRFQFGENYAYLTDMGFSISNWCLGGGGRFNIGEHFAIDFSIFRTFYEDAVKNYTDYGNAGATLAGQLGGMVTKEQLSIPGSDKFYRTSMTFGLGLAMKF